MRPCEGFEKAIYSIHARGGWDVYLTGLNAIPKVFIARTRHEPYTWEGVLVLDLARWLLGEQGF